MLTGNPVKLIIRFSIPILIGNIFQQFYSMADTIIVGRTIGVQALAAVGSTGAISFLILGFVMGMTGGFAVITAQKFGANDEEGVRRSVATSLLLCAAGSVLLTALSVAAARPLLAWMNTPADIIGDAYLYIVILFWGLGASMFYNMFSSILRSLGDSKTPLYFLIFASILNIGLDILLIVVFSMGVEGAAIATVSAQLIAAAMCLAYMVRKYPILRLKKEDWRLDRANVLIHLRIGLPMALQFSITAIGVMTLQTALNAFGSSTVAAYTAASKVEQLATQPMNTLGITIATYSAQNLGAGKYSRIREGVRKCALIAGISGILSAIAVVVFGGALTRLFVSGAQTEVIAQSRQYLNTVAAFFVVLAMLYVFRNTLQGIGSSFIPMLGGAIELVARIAVAFTLPGYIGYAGICLASPLAWVFATIPLILAFVYTEKRWGA